MTPDPRVLLHRASLTEAAFYRSLFLSAPPHLAAQLGLNASSFGAASAFVALGWNIPPTNRVLNLGLIEPASEALLDQILEQYATLGINPAVPISAAAAPSALPTWLETRGWRVVDRTALFVRTAPTDVSLPPALHVEQIGSDRADVFARTLIEGFPLPAFFGEWMAATVGREGWQHYVAFDQAQPVATGVLYTVNRVGYLGWAATLEAHRGRGVQRALIQRRVNDAFNLGCDLVAVDTEEDTPDRPSVSHRNQVRAGLTVVDTRMEYQRITSDA